MSIVHSEVREIQMNNADDYNMTVEFTFRPPTRCDSCENSLRGEAFIIGIFDIGSPSMHSSNIDAQMVCERCHKKHEVVRDL